MCLVKLESLILDILENVCMVGENVNSKFYFSKK